MTVIRKFAKLPDSDPSPRSTQRWPANSDQRISDKATQRSDSIHHVVIPEPEVVSELVDDGFAHLNDDLLPGVADAEDGAAEDRDLIGKHEHVVRAAGARDAAVEAEQLAAGLVGIVVQYVEIVLGRLVLHDDGHVLDQVGEPFRKAFDGPFHELLEFGGRDVHCRYRSEVPGRAIPLAPGTLYPATVRVTSPAGC